MTLHARITKIDIERFAVDLTTKSSDLADKNNEWRYEELLCRILSEICVKDVSCINNFNDIL